MVSFPCNRCNINMGTRLIQLAAAPTDMDHMDQPVLVEVGSRCVSEGCYGTVRYVGEVPPAKGEQRRHATDDALDRPD